MLRNRSNVNSSNRHFGLFSPLLRSYFKNIHIVELVYPYDEWLQVQRTVTFTGLYNIFT